MSELELYKFVQDKELDWRSDGHLKLWLSPHYFSEFAGLIDRCSADDGGLECWLQQDGTICLNLDELCEEYEINPENILKKSAS